ncbi:MAG: J domain-containing protein [Deltaproteobacteria bacterium]|nr:J domain-containing protein [Deltaproteobacteria bacterium]
MTLKEAREILGLGETATRQEIKAAYRRQARRWHPDRAPSGEEARFRTRMQEVNAAYQRLKDFMENFRYPLDDVRAADSQEDIESWWASRFATGVWGAGAKSPRKEED